MKIIVVTGGIGSGKSEVCRILSGMGMKAQYNADIRVKSLYDEHMYLLSRVEEAIGSELRDEEGKFLPRKLAGVIFNDPRMMEAVEKLVFPVLMEDFGNFAAGHSDEDFLVFESATILEKPFFDGFGDKRILVDAPYPVRLERACMRDGVPLRTVEARMACQPLMNSLSEGHSDPRVDAVIMNDSGFDELKERTREVISHLFDN